MAHIFISYSRRDTPTIRELIRFLKSRGYTTWRDAENLEPGGDWNVGLEMGIREADLVLMVASSNSIQSKMVMREATWAENIAKKLVIPIAIEKVDLPLVLYTNQYIAMYENWTEACEELDQQLQKLLKNRPTAIVKESLEPPASPKPVISSNQNPFSGFGTAVHESQFCGREEELSMIIDRLAGLELSSTSIIGERRVGKTSLLNYLMRCHETLLPKNYQWAFAYMDMSTGQASTREAFMELLRQSILEWSKFEAWSPADNGNLDVMKKAFEHLKQTGVRLVLCIDEFEGSIAYDKELRPLFNELRSAGSHGKIAMLTSTRVSLTELFDKWGRVSPFANIFANVRLKPMGEEEWQKMVHKGFEQTGQQVTPDQMAIIEELAGGHPYLTKIAAFFAWQYKHLRWSQAETQIREKFIEQAREPFFHDLWMEQENTTKDAIRSILGLPTPEPVKRKEITELKSRGLLNASGKALFCQPFADYLLEELE